MSKIIVNHLNSQSHVNRISGVVGEYSNGIAGIIRADKTTLSAIANGNASFDDSSTVLMGLAHLSQQLTNNIETLTASFMNIDKQQASIFNRR